MLTPFEHRAYRQFRKDGQSAREAYASIVTLRFEPQHDFLNDLRDRDVVTAEIDGFDITVTVAPDPDAEPLGRFTDRPRSNEATIPNTTSTRGQFYAIDEAEWMRIYTSFRAAGYSRPDAERARLVEVDRMMTEDATAQYVVLTVTVEVDGESLGRDILGGLNVADDFGRRYALQEADAMVADLLACATVATLSADLVNG